MKYCGRRSFLGKNRFTQQGGFTYIGLLFAVALVGIALAGTGSLWQLESQREKEKELLFIGEEFRQAIASYYDQSPGFDKQYPENLGDLLLDKRFPNPVRHLRRLYRDPILPDGNWGLILSQGRVIGVFCKAPGKPVKIAGFLPEQQDFEGADTYADWRFIHGAGSGNPLPAAVAGAGR